MGANDLGGAEWFCGSTSPGSVDRPSQLNEGLTEWIPATVPGTAAGALRAAGRWEWGLRDEQLLDGRDWWFRCTFDAPAGSDGPWDLELDGLATLADVWLNDEHLLTSANMFVSHRVPVEALRSQNELVIRCAALGPVLARRHRRPRWKSRLVRSQSLRWYRTTLLGRMPGWAAWAAPVGPWRPVTLSARDPQGALRNVALHAVPDMAGGGTISFSALLLDAVQPVSDAVLHADGRSAAVMLTPTEDGTLLAGTVHLEQVERWWPHTHGAQPRYQVDLELDGEIRPIRPVGFRTIEVDRDAGEFAVRINGVPIFCRGAIWGPADGVSLAADAEQVRANVGLARDAGMNMLRVAGYITYEDSAFWDACDSLGVMVWQDCMLASMDPPEEEEFVAGLVQELREVFGSLSGRPALTVACGSSETYQQASMYGLEAAKWDSPLLERTIPGLLRSIVPDVPYVPSSPSGGELPFSPDAGVAHYFGVGAYLRPASDARLAGVRFAAECLSFGTPPEPESVEQAFGGPEVAGHAPNWKLAVARDAGTAWDFEDIRDHYVRRLFGIDPLEVRYADPARALDLGRAAIAELIGIVVADWRRPRSPCHGSLVLTWQDLWPGAGWGVIDAYGRPKASYYALRRVFAPRTVLINDDGLSGLRLLAINDLAEPVDATLTVTVFSATGAEIERGEQGLALAGHSAQELRADALLGGFRDLNNAYRFGPLGHDLVMAELSDGDRVLARSCHLAAGPARALEPDIGLAAQAERGADGSWTLSVSSRRLAQYVAIDAPGYRPSDSWFHVPPAGTVAIRMQATESTDVPAGTVRALNAARPVRIET